MSNTTKESRDTNTKTQPIPPEQARKRVRGQDSNPPRPDQEERIDLEDDEEEGDEDTSAGVVKIEGDEEG